MCSKTQFCFLNLRTYFIYLCCYLLIVMAAATRVVNGLKCYCNHKECDPIESLNCPSKGILLLDPCKCCYLCAKTLGETCGGPGDFSGECEPPLKCVTRLPVSKGLGICMGIICLQYRNVKGKKIEFTASKCIIKDCNIVKFVNHSIPDPTRLSVSLAINRNVTEFDIKVNFDVIKKDNRKENFFRFFLNGCQFLEFTAVNPLVKIVGDEVFRSSNVPRKCPIIENKIFSIRNLSIDGDKLPRFISAMNWEITLGFFVKKINVGDFILTGRIF